MTSFKGGSTHHNTNQFEGYCCPHLVPEVCTVKRFQASTFWENEEKRQPQEVLCSTPDVFNNHHREKCAEPIFGVCTKPIRLDIMPQRTNLCDLIDEVYDEKSAIQYFQDEGLLHESRRCSRGHMMRLGQRSRHSGRNSTPRWRCHIRKCRCEVTVKRDTFFEESKVPLRKVTLDNLNWFGQSR